MSGELPSPPAAVETGGPPPRRAFLRLRPAPHGEPHPDMLDLDLRLLIEQTDAPEHEVYTIVDRRSGEVVGRFLRDEMQKRADQGRYAAGDGIKFTA